MITVVPSGDGNGAQWRLISRTEQGADVLATAAITANGGRRGAAGMSWQEAVERLRDGEGDLRIAATADGHCQWILADPSGPIVARSPAVYRDAESCRSAYSAARRAARAVIGAAHQRRWDDPAAAKVAPAGGVRRPARATDSSPEHPALSGDDQ